MEPWLLLVDICLRAPQTSRASQQLQGWRHCVASGMSLESWVPCNHGTVVCIIILQGMLLASDGHDEEQLRLGVPIAVGQILQVPPADVLGEVSLVCLYSLDSDQLISQGSGTARLMSVTTQ